MSFYSLPYEQALQLPLRTFWMMSNNINRLNAEQDIRSLSLAGAQNNGEAFKQAQVALKNEMGPVVTRKLEDEAKQGIADLKRMMGRMNTEDQHRK